MSRDHVVNPDGGSAWRRQAGHARWAWWILLGSITAGLMIRGALLTAAPAHGYKWDHDDFEIGRASCRERV